MPDTPVLRAAIYARKSTQQRGADDEAKSVVRKSAARAPSPRGSSTCRRHTKRYGRRSSRVRRPALIRRTARTGRSRSGNTIAGCRDRRPGTAPRSRRLLVAEPITHRLPQRLVHNAQMVGRNRKPLGFRSCPLALLAISVSLLRAVPRQYASVQVAMEHLAD